MKRSFHLSNGKRPDPATGDETEETRRAPENHTNNFLSLRERVGVRVFFFLLSALLFPPIPSSATMPDEFQGMYIFKDFGSRENHGAPSGWMGDFRDLRIDANWTNNPHSGTSCIKLVYTAEGSRHANMVGVMWQHPANNDGSVDGGIDLTGARRIVFWARGEKGGEFIHAFTFGGILGAYPDTDKTVLADTFLSTNWTRYEIDLTGLDLSYISSFFGWATGRFHNPDGMVFYLDEIRIE